jgi:hypothetical protein
MRRNIPLLLWATLILFIASGCAKDDVLKNPTSVKVHFALNSAGVGGSDRLALTSGHLVLSEIELSGQRVEGEAFSFRRTFPNGLHYDFGVNNNSEELLFDLPQGEYELLEVTFKTLEGGQEATLLVQGTYGFAQSNNNALVNIAWKSSRAFQKHVLTTNNQPNFTLAETPKTVTFTIQPKLWFREVTEIKLEQAHCTLEPQGLFMRIDQTSNSNMFQVLDEALGTTLTATL